jgi:tRNA pseudouridine55 synthase
LLPVCFGEATKFSADLLDADKTYEAELRFGVTTDTGDAEGAVIECRPVAFERAELESVLPRFLGTIEQIPPMYSALKRNGRPLYELARQGIEVARASRRVVISELMLLDVMPGACRLRVTCSKGTYIRSLASDIGESLECGAHLTALRRTRVGALSIGDAVTLDDLTESDEGRLAEWLLPVDTLLQRLPKMVLDAESAARFIHGNSVVSGSEPGKQRVYDENRLLGVGETDVLGKLRPVRLVATT